MTPPIPFNPHVDAPVESITELIQNLVQTPSRGGADDYEPIVKQTVSSLRRLGLTPDVIMNGGAAAAVTVDVTGSRPGPRYVLDACLDTAGVGDPKQWTCDPFSGEIRNGWLHGRGSADSKAAVSIFSHLAAELAQRPDFAGDLSLLFDLDEHTGGFAGIRRYLEQTTDIAGVMIGYPGTGKVVTGGRGFYRVRITVHGEAAHTGATNRQGVNAIARAIEIAQRLQQHRPWSQADAFPHPPKLTVTAIRGGEPGNFSVVPDRAEVEVDIRLTPAFTAEDAAQLVTRDVDGWEAGGMDVEQVGDSWPAFQLPPDHRLPAALLAGARSVGLDPTAGPAGPSNIGCYLASHGIPATAGFGVAYTGLHGTDEAIDLATLPQVYGAYRAAALSLLRA